MKLSTPGFGLGTLLCALACSSEGGDSSDQGGGAPLGGAPAWGGAGGGGIAEVGGAPSSMGGCIEPVTGARKHPGCYDTRGCASGDCHNAWSGGWLYTDRAGCQPVSDATITIENPDGSVVSGVSAVDGFFSLIGANAEIGRIGVPYVPCVSKCPNSVCGSKATHTAVDCQTSDCHGAPNQLIYLTGQDSSACVAPPGVGGGGPTDCIPATPGGPRTHTPDQFDNQACQVCHDQLYTGGFLYDSPERGNPVWQATVTLTPVGGTPQTALTGPGGMFYFPGLVTAPYDVCVSKCPDRICAPAGTHVNQRDCRRCHNGEDAAWIHLP